MALVSKEEIGRRLAALSGWELSGKEIRDIHDFMYVLQRAKPGEKATAVVVRDGQKVELDVTFGGKK